ncbi:MAG: extradiol ring-cleavage dioxygenase [Firmicutes bacterium HGW-Firmicutes-11]|jgi:AmmeMemoRadiSam system protein A|nr:MAG: extradiol ring-cleavage dioxygenase [Firmicutes bacterium HGW-Firmicutes-11]
MSVLAGYIVPHPPLIVPDVGGGQEHKIQKTIDAYQTIAAEIRDLAPDTIVVATPHSIMYRDYIHVSPGASARGDLKRFGDTKTELRISYDQELVNELGICAARNGIPAGSLGEKDKNLDHGILVPLWFLQQELKDVQWVRTSISGLSALDHYRFGKCIAEVAADLDRRVVVVASGDLSHRLSDQGPYDFSEEGPVFDQEVTAAMESGDFLKFLSFPEEFCEAAGECGLRSIQIMAGALDGHTVEPRLLSYEGTFGVGYAVASFLVTGVSRERCFDLQKESSLTQELAKLKSEESEYVRLARRALETYVTSRKTIERPTDLSVPLTEEKAGVFVSLKKDGQLRGCIGTIEPVEACIADEIIRNAISAGVGDPRFDPVTKKELPELVYSVDVLGKAEPIEDLSQLDVIRYGVIVSKGRKRGLLLPNLEGVRTPQQQVEIALQKAGIDPKDDFRMERFEVVRHK